MCAVSVLIAIFAPTKHGEVGETHPSPPEGRELNGADDVQGTVQ